jgi:hypothetical protein
MIPMLYFPWEHKYAILIPLIFPIIFPILNGLKLEFKRYLRLRNEMATPSDQQQSQRALSQSRYLTLTDLH